MKLKRLEQKIRRILGFYRRCLKKETGDITK